MPAQPISILKAWFQTGDKPTEQQFGDLLDSFRSIQEGVPAADVTGLQSVIDDRITQVGGGGGGGTSIYTPVSVDVSGANTYALASEVLAKDFIIIPLLVGKIDIGTTVGGDELITFVPENTDPVFIDLSNFSLTGRTLHFTGQFQVRFITANYAA